MAAIPTVKIVSKDSEHGYLVINKADFSAKDHELFVEKKEIPKREIPSVMKRNKK